MESPNYLFHDQRSDKKIQKSIGREIEAGILQLAWDELTIFTGFQGF
jgi:hypothetical protein